MMLSRHQRYMNVKGISGKTKTAKTSIPNNALSRNIHADRQAEATRPARFANERSEEPDMPDIT